MCCVVCHFPEDDKFFMDACFWQLQEQTKISHDRHDRNRGAVEEARNQWQQSEERAKALNDKLLTALADITTKDNLVKQHVKVAEEAVTGT